MIDKEKVIKGLKHCSEDGCNGCPYNSDCHVFSELAKDTLKLLKEQESEENETGLSVTQEDIETLMNLIEKTLRKTHYQTVGCNNTCIWLQTFIDAIELLKVRKRGRWVRLTGMAPPEYHGHKICSVCECFAPYDPFRWSETLPKYCPGCGAEMEGGAE